MMFSETLINFLLFSQELQVFSGRLIILSACERNKKIRRLVCVLLHLLRSTLMTLTRLIFSRAAKPSRTSKKSPWSGIWPFQEFTMGYRKLTRFRNSATPLQWNWWQLEWTVNFLFLAHHTCVRLRSALRAIEFFTFAEITVFART